MKIKITVFFITSIFLFSTFNLSAQLPGFINRQATSPSGRTVLDPNGDGYTSTTAAGFGNNDVVNSELIYQGIKAYPIEPYSDLVRGPNHNYSDFVPDSAGNAVYHRFSAAMNMMFRMRMGSIMPGSKGYSILMDTDGKFGATGANADPNYQPATTGTNGNPGFEIEIVLETNFRIAIYNVDGTSSPVLVKQYLNWQDMSQVSIASTNDNGDPDFLIDFYIPFSDLQAAPFNLTTASPIRMTATTVMSPQAATGGPRSDIYGTSGGGYDFILDQPPCNIFTTPANCPTAMCTAAPAVNSPISTGTVNITGTWTKSAITGAASQATIIIYKNGFILDSVTNVNSGSSWSLNNITLISNEIITAKARATNESICLTSNAVAASTCNSTNQPATPILSCTSGSKGLGGTNLSTGWTIHVDNVTRNVFDDNVTNGTGLFGAQTGSSPNITWLFSGGCSSGAPLASGSYKVYYTNNSNGCNSLPAYFCAAGNGANALAGSLAVPVITAPVNSVFTTATKTISGTTDANATVFLFINSNNVQTTTATAGGLFTFSGLNLLNGQQLYLVVELNTGIVGTSKCANQTALFTVTCFTQPPLINADNNNQITASLPITGTSTEPVGTTIRVYTSTNVLVATTTVQANGTWSTGNAGTLPATYNAIAATSYYSNAQNGSCGLSINSATYAASSATSAARCGNISGPVTPGVASISGTLTGSFTTTTVYLYLDGELIGSTTTNGTAWGPITVNSTATNTLYSNAVLSIGIRESGKQEVACPGSALAILCTPTPTAPVYSLSSNSVTENQTVTCTITNAVIGTFYALSDSSTGVSFGQGAWATSNGNLVLTTNAFTTPGTYKLKVSATSLSGLTVCKAVSASTTIVVNPIVLPLTLLEFTVKKLTGNNLLNWITENEISLSRFEIERSSNGRDFYKIGGIMASGIGNTAKSYAYTDQSPLATVNYYRLKMIDIDGKFSYSKIIAVTGDQSASLVIEKISPNPFVELINIDLVLQESQQLNIQLVNIEGRVVITRNYNGKKGNNKITCNGLTGLAPGIYCIKIITADMIVQQKLLKQ
jgi:hypothetical protein